MTTPAVLNDAEKPSLTVERVNCALATVALPTARPIKARFVTVLSLPTGADLVLEFRCDNGAWIPARESFKLDAGAGHRFKQLEVRGVGLTGDAIFLCANEDAEPFNLAGRAVGGAGTGPYLLALLAGSTTNGRWIADPANANAFYFGINWNGAAADDPTKPSWLLWFSATTDEILLLHRAGGSPAGVLSVMGTIGATDFNWQAGGVAALTIAAINELLASGMMRLPGYAAVNAAATPYVVTSLVSGIEVDASAGAVVINLPAVAGGEGRDLLVVRLDSSANLVTIVPNGTNTINGANASWQVPPGGAVALRAGRTASGKWFARTTGTMTKVVASGASPYTVLPSDEVLYGDDTAANVVFNLPAVAGVPDGKAYHFKKFTAAAFSVTITPSGAETIDLVNAPLVMAIPLQGFSLRRAGAGWAIVGSL